MFLYELHCFGTKKQMHGGRFHQLNNRAGGFHGIVRLLVAPLFPGLTQGPNIWSESAIDLSAVR